MRRADRAVQNFDELVQILEKCDVCRLAFHDEPYPYILPLNFGIEVTEGRLALYFHGAQSGKKYELLANNDHVAFEADCSHQLITPENNAHCTMRYESVMGYGRLQIVPEEEKRKGLENLMRHYVDRQTYEFPEQVVRQTVVLRLDVESMTGKRR